MAQKPAWNPSRIPDLVPFGGWEEGASEEGEEERVDVVPLSFNLVSWQSGPLP